MLKIDLGSGYVHASRHLVWHKKFVCHDNVIIVCRLCTVKHVPFGDDNF